MGVNEHLPDEWEALLGGRDGDGGALREALRGQVMAAFVRRRRRRRVRRALGMAACYLLGVVTIYAWQRVSVSPVEGGDATASRATEPSRDVVQQAPVERPDVARVTPQAHGATPQEPVSPIAAKRAKKSRFDALRELGDQHLVERDPEQALRCYRVALRYATDEEFTAAAREGSWLLRAICLDTKQEKGHAPEKS